MTLISIQPDRQWFIQEQRLRFPVNCEVPRELVPVVAFRDIQRSIEICERLRGWKLLLVMPTHRRILEPCCTQVASARTGTPLPMRFEPSPLQGDTDDVHNSGEAVTDNSRLLVDNKIDWVAVMHFWSPGIVVDPDVSAELKGPRAGLVSSDLLPNEYLAGSTRYADVYRNLGNPTADPGSYVWRKASGAA